jgi:hypothetical protein
MKSIRNKISLTVSSLLALGALFVPVSVNAAPTAVFSISPAGGTYTIGSTFTVSIYEDSGSDSVDSARAELNYNQGSLQLLSVTNSGSPFTTCVTGAGGGSGHITTGDCTLLGGKKQGKQRLGQATFKVTASTGTASVVFTASSQAVNAGVDLAESFSNGSYTLAATTSPATSPTPPPAQAPPASNPAGSPTKKTTTSNNNGSTATTTTTPEVEETNGEVKSGSDKKKEAKKDENKKDQAEAASDKANIWTGILVAIAAGAAFFAGRRYVAQRAAIAKAKDEAKQTPAKKAKRQTKNQSKKANK